MYIVCVRVCACVRVCLCRTSLKAASPFEYDNGAQAIFNYAFCSNVTTVTCPADSRYFTPSLQLVPNGSGQCLQSYGSLSSTQASPMATPTDGMTLVYGGGEKCDSLGTQSSTTFELMCDPSVSVLAVKQLEVPNVNCALKYTIRTPAACPTFKAPAAKPLSGGWVVFIIFVVAIIVYLVGGVIFKRVKYQASGIEAIPNIDFWRSVGERLSRCLTCRRQYQPANESYYTEQNDV